MQADNDLEKYAYWDLAEMEKAAQLDIPVVVELDLPGNDGIYRLKVGANKSLPPLDQIDFSDWSLDNLSSNIIAQFGEHQFSQPERLLNFLIDAEERYPTKHTLLVIWGHGEGFGSHLVAQFGGVAVDDNPHSKISIQEVNEALKTYKTIFNKNIDILSMDACLMQTLEVATELIGNVDYVIGSTQIQDFRGLPYDSILKYIGGKLNFDSFESGSQPHTLAQAIPAIFEERAKSDFDNDKRTMSSINLNEIELALLPELNKTAALIHAYLKEDPFYKLDILDLIDSRPFFLGESRDLSSLLSAFDEFFHRQNRVKVSEQIRMTMEIMHRSSMAYYYGNSYVVDNRIHLGSFKAFGLWLPSKLEDYALRRADFEQSALFRLVPNWKLLLSELYSNELF